MGFENIGRLKKGIIAYEKWVGVNDSNEDGEESTQLVKQIDSSEDILRPVSVFKGENYLFDRRRIIEIGDENEGQHPES